MDAVRHVALDAVGLELIAAPRKGLPSGVSRRRPPTFWTGPLGPCVPGTHFGNQSLSLPGWQGTWIRVCKSRRGKSRASTSICRVGFEPVPALRSVAHPKLRNQVKTTIHARAKRYSTMRQGH